MMTLQVIDSRNGKFPTVFGRLVCGPDDLPSNMRGKNAHLRAQIHNWQAEPHGRLVLRITKLPPSVLGTSKELVRLYGKKLVWRKDKKNLARPIQLDMPRLVGTKILTTTERSMETILFSWDKTGKVDTWDLVLRVPPILRREGQSVARAAKKSLNDPDDDDGLVNGTTPKNTELTSRWIWRQHPNHALDVFEAVLKKLNGKDIRCFLDDSGVVDLKREVVRLDDL